MKPGKSRGNRNISNKMTPSAIPANFAVFSNIFFADIFMDPE